MKDETHNSQLDKDNDGMIDEYEIRKVLTQAN